MAKNIVQVKQLLVKFYSNSALLETAFKRSYADLKCGHADTNHTKYLGHPNSAFVLENTRKLHKLVLAEHKLNLYEIAEELKILESQVFTILHEHLSMRNLCSLWVLCLFTVDEKQHVNNSEHYLQLFECNK